MMKLKLRFISNTISISGIPANTKTTLGMRQAKSSTKRKTYYV